MNSRQRYKYARAAENRERKNYIKRIDSAFTRLSEGCSKRVVRAVAASGLASHPDHRKQLESRAEAIERSQKRIWYKQPGERGVTCSGRQKLKLSSKPLM